MASPETGDTLTDINTAVGDLLNGASDVPDVLDDDALDAELSAQSGVADAVVADAPETPAVPDATGEPVAAAPVAETPVVEDPLKDAKPFDYTVDGQAKIYGGIKVLSDKDGNVQGGIIQPEALKDVQYRLQRGEYLEGQNKSLYEQTRAFDAITFTDRATNTELKGIAAAERYVTENAKLTAAVELLAKTLEDPDKLAAIYGDPRELSLLTRELGIAAHQAEAKSKSQFTQRIAQAKEVDSTTQDRAQVTTQSIQGAVEHWAKQFPTLTKDDTQKAVAYFSKIGSAIVRPATPDEAKTAGVKPGELIIDHPVLYEYLSDRAALRKEAIASSTAAATAARENAARLAQAARGKPATPTKAKPAKATVPAEPEGETWAQQKNRLQTGAFSPSDDD